MNCLFLGYNNKETSLIKFLKKKKIFSQKYKKRIKIKRSNKG